VLGGFHRLGRGQFYHLPSVGELRVLKGVAAGGTLLQFVLYRVGRCLLPRPSTVLAFGTLAPRLLWCFIFSFRSGGLDEGGRGRRLTVVLVFV
jgi:hypothetical protein